MSALGTLFGTYWEVIRLLCVSYFSVYKHWRASSRRTACVVIIIILVITIMAKSMLSTAPWYGCFAPSLIFLSPFLLLPPSAHLSIVFPAQRDTFPLSLWTPLIVLLIMVVLAGRHFVQFYPKSKMDRVFFSLSIPWCLFRDTDFFFTVWDALYLFRTYLMFL